MPFIGKFMQFPQCDYPSNFTLEWFINIYFFTSLPSDIPFLIIITVPLILQRICSSKLQYFHVHQYNCTVFSTIKLQHSLQFFERLVHQHSLVYTTTTAPYKYSFSSTFLPHAVIVSLFLFCLRLYLNIIFPLTPSRLFSSLMASFSSQQPSILRIRTLLACPSGRQSLCHCPRTHRDIRHYLLIRPF